MSGLAIPVSAFGGAAGGALVWRTRGELFLSATVKVELALAHDAVASITSATELVRADHPFGDAMRPLELPSDLSPPLPHPEVLLVGQACAPGQRPVPSMSVRLFVGREDRALIDKTLHVYGDRSNGAREPRPFVRMPLGWALAVGGPNTDNPAGRALNDPLAPPNVVDPHSPWASAGFAPVAAGWPLRRRALHSGPPQLVAGVLEVPADASMEYFQCAPLDQRVASLAGDEWIVIDGMHAERTRFQSQLPSLRARARLARGGLQRPLGEPMPFALTLDRLFIDMQRWTAQLSWRGSMRVEPSELMEAQVVVGVESPADDSMELSNETMMLSEEQLNGAMDQALPWELEPPPPPRKSSGGRVFGGLPFKPPASAAPLPSPSAPGSAFAPTATSHAVTPTFGQAPIEIANESTITSVDDQLLAALPFGQAAEPRRLWPPTFAVPRALEEAEDDTGQTKVAPILSPADSPLPFGGSQPSPPAVVPVTPQEISRPTTGSLMASRPLLVTMPVLPVLGPAPVASSMGPSALAADAVLVPTPLPTLLVDPVTEEPTPAVVEPTRAVAGPSALLGSSGLALGAGTTPTEGAPPEPPAEDPAPQVVAASPEEALKQLLLDNVRNDIAMYDMDLGGAELADMDLRGAKLGGAKLTGANLSGALLRDARLANAKLSGANLRGADLGGADLSGADLSRADLTDAKLDGATLTGANLSSVQASGARFFRVLAERVQFVQAQLERASFEVASVRDADFSGATIGKACFRGAKADAAIFSEVRGESAIFDDAELASATFGGAGLPDLSCVAARATRSNWERAELDRAVFDRADLSHATLVRASMEVASFLAADLSKADLSNVSGDGADFTDANLSGADLRMSKLSDARFSKAKLVESNGQKLLANNARMDGADLSRASFRGARMKGCQLSSATLDGTDLRDADLEGSKLDGTDTSKAKLAGANLRGVEGVSS